MGKFYYMKHESRVAQYSDKNCLVTLNGQKVPSAAVHHIRRVVRTGARVIERNRAFIFRVPSIRTWRCCLCWGIWGSGRSDQSRFVPTHIFFCARLSPFLRPGQDTLLYIVHAHAAHVNMLHAHAHVHAHAAHVTCDMWM